MWNGTNYQLLFKEQLHGMAPIFKEQLHGMAPIFLNLLIMFLFLISLSLNGNGLFRIPRFIS